MALLDVGVGLKDGGIRGREGGPDRLEGSGGSWHVQVGHWILAPKFRDEIRVTCDALVTPRLPSRRTVSGSHQCATSAHCATVPTVAAVAAVDTSLIIKMG